HGGTVTAPIGEADRGSPANPPACCPAGGSATAGSSRSRVTSSRAIASRETCSSALARSSASSSIRQRKRSASARAAASRRLSSSISEPIHGLLPPAHDGRRPHRRSTGNQAKLQVGSPFRRAAPIRDTSIDAVLADLAPSARHADLVAAWLATPTWDESQRLLAAHPELLSDQRTDDILRAFAAGDENSAAVARQHHAILALCRRSTLDEAYEVVTDLDAGSEAA